MGTQIPMGNVPAGRAIQAAEGIRLRSGSNPIVWRSDVTQDPAGTRPWRSPGVREAHGRAEGAARAGEGRPSPLEGASARAAPGDAGPGASPGSSPGRRRRALRRPLPSRRDGGERGVAPARACSRATGELGGALRQATAPPSLPQEARTRGAAPCTRDGEACRRVRWRVPRRLCRCVPGDGRG